MRLKRIVKSTVGFVRRGYDKAFVTACILSSLQISFADDTDNSPIPISSNDQTTSGTDFITTLMKIVQKDLVPFMEILAAVWIIWTGITTMANGVKEAQERQKFDPLKNAIIKTVIVVVVGGALIYLLDRVRTLPTPS